jgi:hypothetical protein
MADSKISAGRNRNRIMYGLIEAHEDRGVVNEPKIVVDVFRMPIIKPKIVIRGV